SVYARMGVCRTGSATRVGRYFLIESSSSSQVAFIRTRGCSHEQLDREEGWGQFLTFHLFHSRYPSWRANQTYSARGLPDCPSLCASNEHILIVHVPRARRTVWLPLHIFRKPRVARHRRSSSGQAVLYPFPFISAITLIIVTWSSSNPPCVVLFDSLPGAAQVKTFANFFDAIIRLKYFSMPSIGVVCPFSSD